MFVGILQRREVRGLPGGVKHSGTHPTCFGVNSQHLRKPIEENGHKKPGLKRTDFGGPRQCMGQRRNVFLTERSVDENCKTQLSNDLVPSGRICHVPVQSSRLLCVSHHTPLSTEMINITSTSKNRWSRIMSELTELHYRNESRYKVLSVPKTYRLVITPNTRTAHGRTILRLSVATSLTHVGTKRALYGFSRYRIY